MIKAICIAVLLIAFNQTASYAATYTAYGSTNTANAYRLADGIITTYWGFGVLDTLAGHWAALEFSEPVSVTSLKHTVNFADTASLEAFTPATLQIQVSDSPVSTAVWTPLKTFNLVAVKDNLLALDNPVTCKSIRVYVTSLAAINGAFNWRLYELTPTFSTAAATTTTTTTATTSTTIADTTTTTLAPPLVVDETFVTSIRFTNYSTRLQVLQVQYNDMVDRMLDGAYILGGILALIFAVTWKG